jgi:hypothetical protein
MMVIRFVPDPTSAACIEFAIVIAGSISVDGDVSVLYVKAVGVVARCRYA